MSTPIRAQYLRLKRPFPDVLLLFRLRDFYELYDEDARLATRELGMTLNAREFRRRADACDPATRATHGLRPPWQAVCRRGIGAATHGRRRVRLRLASPTGAGHGRMVMPPAMDGARAPALSSRSAVFGGCWARPLVILTASDTGRAAAGRATWSKKRGETGGGA
jgi:hypothetical protein